MPRRKASAERSHGSDSAGSAQKKLGVIRKQSAEVCRDNDLNAAAIQRRMAEHEQEIRDAEGAEARARSMAMKDAVKRAAVWLSIAGIVICAGIVWMTHHAKVKQARRQEALKVESVERQKQEVERKSAEDARRLESESRRIEKDRREAEAQAKAKERQQKLDEERQKRKEEMARKNAELEAAREKDRVFDAVQGQRILPWSALPRTERPGKYSGSCVCIVQDNGEDMNHYEVISTTNDYQVFWCRPGGIREPLETKDFESRIAAAGTVAKVNEVLYFLPPKPGARETLLNTLSGTFSDVAKLCFGKSLCRYLRQRNVDMSSAVFELTFPGYDKVQPKRRVKDGESVDFYAIMTKIMEAERAGVRVKKPKPFRKSVRWYDGPMVRRQLDVTSVPRATSNPDPRYMELAAEARRQEELAQQYAAKFESEVSELRDKAAEKARETAVVTVRLVQ